MLDVCVAIADLPDGASLFDQCFLCTYQDVSARDRGLQGPASTTQITVLRWQQTILLWHNPVVVVTCLNLPRLIVTWVEHERRFLRLNCCRSDYAARGRVAMSPGRALCSGCEEQVAASLAQPHAAGRRRMKAASPLHAGRIVICGSINIMSLRSAALQCRRPWQKSQSLLSMRFISAELAG